MEKLFVKFQNASEEEQLKMFDDLTIKLHLLEISTFKKNPKMISERIISKVSMHRLIELYNSAKSQELKNKIIDDKFYQRAFKKTENFPSNNYNTKTPFFQDIDLIVKKFFETQNNHINNNLLSFINKYSSFLIYSNSSENFRTIIDVFFQNKNKEHNIDISLLNKLSVKQLMIIYDHYSELPNQEESDNLLSYIRNKADFETYLKHKFKNDSQYFRMIKDARFFLSSDTDDRRIYGEGIYPYSYNRNDIKTLLSLYFKFSGITEEDEIKVLKFLEQRTRVNFDNFPEDKQFLQYLIHNTIRINPARIAEIMYGYYGPFPQFGFVIKEIEIILYFNFLPMKNYLYSIEYLEEYDISLIKRINFLHIKNIFNNLDPKVYGDEILFGLRIVINMYLVFGYNRTIDILKGKYGEVSNDFFNNISKIKIAKDILDDQNNIKLKQGYLNILFNQEKNSNFQEIINDYSVSSLIYVLYNYYDELVAEYGKLTLKKCIELLNDQNNIMIMPRNNQLLRKDIFNNIIVGNRRNKELAYLMMVIEKNYQEQQARVTSSIPYLEGEYEGYFYQTMRLNDPIIYNIGYLANCCFRMTDIGENDLRHASLDKNARVLLIYNEKREVIAFSVLNRNGEVIIITSVEYDSRNSKIDTNKLLSVLKKFSAELYEKINTSDDQIKLITIGASSKIKPKENMPFPSKYPTPRCALEDKYQANSYHFYQHLLLKENNLDYETLKYNIEVKTYQDPRLPIKRIIIDEENINEYINLVQRINNTLTRDLLKVGGFLVFNEDWYILVTTNGQVIGKLLDYDNRANQEYNEIKNHLIIDNQHTSLQSYIDPETSSKKNSEMIKVRKLNQ